VSRSRTTEYVRQAKQLYETNAHFQRLTAEQNCRSSEFSRYLPACMLRAGTVFGGFCMYVYVSVRTISRKLLIRNWCNLVGTCPTENARSGWKLVTFDLESYFRTFSIKAIYFEWLDLSGLRYILRIFRPWFTFKVITCNSKTTGRKLLRLDQNSCYDNARSNFELLAFWPWPLILRNISYFLTQTLSFECLTHSSFIYNVMVYLEYLGYFRVSKS